jgi:hypothetical protein
MDGGRSLIIEPDKWAFEADEATFDETRARALLEGPDPDIPDREMVLTLLELIRDEVRERLDDEDGLLAADQLDLAFASLAAAAHRAGWTGSGLPVSSAATVGGTPTGES